ncbi:MAG TPA: hypothetical protein VGV91_12640 [Rubrobacter sp.]|nr:hypothetical protein [Rubrobacter sp.]
MEETPPTNELVGRLAGKLSPAGRDALARLDSMEPDPLSGTEPDVDGALGLVDLEALTAKDRGTIVRILELRARHQAAREDEYLKATSAAEHGTATLERAHKLERAAGREPDPNMTLAEALAVLERHGVMRWTPPTSPTRGCRA